MTESRTEILKNWQQQLVAMDEADTDALRECFTHDAVLIHMTGYRQLLEDWLEGMRRQEFVYHQVIEKHVAVEIAGEHAVLTGDIITGYRSDGSGQAWPLHCVQQFIHKDGAWLCTESRVSLG
ncbi:nuclear transport factor 2 family protein [Kocuria sp. ZOR0020]|uniref:nuclear transport factor 2 family protein n=1 Tax=Kocuria sp. ZOR0020 TaxID=1339234 RepID=UPI0006911337|nr:nuclear transport factor 2 family protein [Kocuria sp. ZOR0020]